MNSIRKTSHLSEIIEESEKQSVIIDIHSLSCGISIDIKSSIENGLENGKIENPVYIVVVQEMPNLSKNIEEVFNIKHESPQVIILRSGMVIYSADHDGIKIENFVY